MSAQRAHTILLVEDDPDLAKLVRFRLEREGWSVRHVSDGEQAQREFSASPQPDLVLLDVMLPYRNGYELLAELRRRKGWEALPVLMLTSRGKEQDVVKGLALGANDYLSKPFRPAELVARVRKLLPKS
ncbi:MAG TPA: response regulator transcription factor [Burkholderiales bacterium]|nr:response regulator transcription factor [Burkholderiales bacterium]